MCQTALFKIQSPGNSWEFSNMPSIKSTQSIVLSEVLCFEFFFGCMFIKCASHLLLVRSSPTHGWHVHVHRHLHILCFHHCYRVQTCRCGSCVHFCFDICPCPLGFVDLIKLPTWAQEQIKARCWMEAPIESWLTCPHVHVTREKPPWNSVLTSGLTCSNVQMQVTLGSDWFRDEFMRDGKLRPMQVSALLERPVSLLLFIAK